MISGSSDLQESALLQVFDDGQLNSDVRLGMGWRCTPRLMSRTQLNTDYCWIALHIEKTNTKISPTRLPFVDHCGSAFGPGCELK